MTIQEFRKLVERYGANSDRWPLDIRKAAKNLITAEPKVTEQILSRARELDEFLDAGQVTPDTELLQRRILKQIEALPQSAPTKTSSPGWRAIAAMLAVAFTLGMVGGRIMPGATPIQNDNSGEVLTAEYEATAEDLGLSDIYAWVEGEGT